MPQLLLLCEYATLNGGERSMLSTLDRAAAAGFMPTVAAPAEGPLSDALRERGIDALPFRTHDATGQRFSQGAIRDALATLLKRQQPDLLHANSLSTARLSGPVAADLGLPSIGHLRDIVRLSRQAMTDLNCHRRLLAVSDATRAYHVAAGMVAEKTHVLHNGVDLRQFQPRTPTAYLHRELDLPPAAILVGTIGQICLRKGQDVLAQAAVALTERLPDVHYLIVGERFSEKDESRRFEAELHQIGSGPLAGRFHLLGFRDDVDRLLGELTLLVHPARQEPLGRVLLESAASAVAVIATNVGGTREIFPPESGSARLVPPDDPELLAAAILKLTTDHHARLALATAARHRAETAFDVCHAAEALVAHYQAVLES